MDWGGRPLTSHEVIVETIGATTTSTGLRVHAELDATYPPGIKIPDQEIEASRPTAPSCATPSSASGTTHCAPIPTHSTAMI